MKLQRLMMSFSMIATASLLAMWAAALSGCGGSEVVDNATTSQRPARLNGVVAKSQAALVLNGDGRVAFDTGSAAYAAMSAQEIEYGQILIDNANARVARGTITINPDFSAVINGAAPQPHSRSTRTAACSTNWWGQTCALDAADTRYYYSQLLLDDTKAAIACTFLGAYSGVCSVLEMVGTGPLELELAPCAKAYEGSTLHVTWVGIGWITCG